MSGGENAALLGLGELARRTEIARTEREDALKRLDAARENLAELAWRIADGVVAGAEPIPEVVKEYKRANEQIRWFARSFAEKDKQFVSVSDQLLEVLKKPSAVAAAEGDETNIQNSN